MKTVCFHHKFAKSAVRRRCSHAARSLQQFSLKFRIVAVCITRMRQNIDAHVHLVQNLGVQNDAWLTGYMVRERVVIEVGLPGSLKLIRLVPYSLFLCPSRMQPTTHRCSPMQQVSEGRWPKMSLHGGIEVSDWFPPICLNAINESLRTSGAWKRNVSWLEFFKYLRM